ncbi:MAG: SPOR domain-containing protein [Proteobacteria bacterium]|nr:SPOR domain-containing protein [Pseudomonadota bacterium]
MADDHNQQAYRAGETASRGQGGGSGNDPLAELARLIGQSDPFGEYGRNNGNRTAAAAADQAAGWPAEPAAHPEEQPTLPNHSAYQEQPYGAPSYGRQAFGSAPLSTDTTEYYPVDAHAPGYRSPGHDADEYRQAGAVPGYEDAFPPSQEPHYDVHQQFGPAASDEYYDDVAPNRRRIGITAIAGIFALAVIGTAGALGYRALFGPSAAPKNPPIIKADNAPSKIVPATPNQDAGKTITDRVGSSGNGQIERLLSREEQPVPVKTVTPNAAGNSNTAFPPNQAGTAPAMGSGVVGDPKKIKTIAIRPDQANDGASAAAETAPTPAATSVAEPPPRPISVTPRPIATTSEPARPVQQPPRQVAAEPAPAPRHSNAPLSLNPNAVQAQAPVQARPERVASTTPAAPAAASTGGYAVQVSAQRSEADAQAAFRALQGKFPDQLGNRAPLIKRVDLGAKGIYFRAMVGPFASSGEASQFCSGLKAAGGQCLIQRN